MIQEPFLADPAGLKILKYRRGFTLGEQISKLLITQGYKCLRGFIIIQIKEYTAKIEDDVFYRFQVFGPLYFLIIASLNLSFYLKF